MKEDVPATIILPYTDLDSKPDECNIGVGNKVTASCSCDAA